MFSLKAGERYLWTGVFSIKAGERDLGTGDCRVVTFIPTSPKQSQKIKNKGKRAALPDSAGGGYQPGEVGLCFMQPTQRV